MQTRFTVGELARLGGVTKQMLIFYDREGVFKPKFVDPENGYRYYTADQIEELDSILILREMGLSLREIRAHMARRGGRHTMELLREQQRAALSKVEHWGRISQRLARKLESMEQFFLAETGGAFLEQRPAEYLAVEPVEGAQGLLDADIALKRLLRRAEEREIPHFYQLGEMVPVAHLLAGDYLHFSHAILPLLGPCEGVEVLVKPAGLYAGRYHVGAYQSMGKTYGALLRDVAARELRVAGPSYELCVLDCLSSKSPEEYITEIQIMVE